MMTKQGTAAGLVALALTAGLAAAWSSAGGGRVPLAPGPATRVAELEWLAGSWSLVRGEDRVEEHWTPPAGETMLGMARIVRGERTVMFEFTRIEVVDGVPAYLAQPRGREPTTFKLVHAGPREAVFENKAHDFPQRIIYRRVADDRLTARIEGTVKGEVVGEDYPFERAPAGVRIP